MTTPHQSAELRPLSDYLATVRRQRVLILCVVLAVLTLAVALTQVQPRSYRATVAVALEPVGTRDDLERLLFGTADLATQQQIITSVEVVRPVLAAQDLPTAGEAVTDFAEDRVLVEAVPGSTVLRITVSQPTAEGAAELAQGLALQYLAYLKQDVEGRVVDAVAELRARAEAARREIALINEQLGAATPARAASLEEERDGLFTTVRFATTRITELQTASALARRGDIIEPAVAPAQPSSPSLVKNLALALLLGTILAVAAAALRDRRNYVLRRPEDLPRRDSNPWVITAPTTEALDDGRSRTARSPSPSGTDIAIARLHTSVLAGAGDRTWSPLVVVPVGPQVPVARLALQLARAAVEVGQPTTLVLTEPASAEIGPAAGGARELEPSDASAAGLSVVVPEPSATGSRVQLIRALDRLDAAPADAGVILPTPPLLQSSDALDVAARARGVLVVASAGTSTRNEWLATVEELERVGARILGTVLLQRR